jgi:hypothetical protein
MKAKPAERPVLLFTFSLYCVEYYLIAKFVLSVSGDTLFTSRV